MRRRGMATNAHADAALDPTLDFAPVCDVRGCQCRAAWIAALRDGIKPKVLLVCDRHFQRINGGWFTMFAGKPVRTLDLIASWRRL